MTKANVSCDFPSKFRPLLREKARYKVYYGGRGSAKSWSIARALIVKAASGKYRILCCREIQSSIRESVHKLLSDTISQLGLDSMFTVTEREIRCATGSEFIFEGLFRNITRIKSLESIDICWVEEGQTISEESIQIMIPTIRNVNSEIWISFNPRYQDDPIYQRFVVAPPDNAIVVKVSWEDNPWFPEVLRKEMEDDFAYRPREAANIWNGEVLHYGATIWEFDKSIHVREFDLKPIPDVRYFQALDPHTSFYSASIWVASWKWADRRYHWVFNEWPKFSTLNAFYSDVRQKIHYNGTVQELARQFFAMESGITISARYIDTRYVKGFGSATSNLINKTEGLVERFAKEANILYNLPAESNIDTARDEVKTWMRYNTLQDRSSLNEPVFYVSQSCVNVIRALTNHRYEENQEKETEIYKDFSDCIRLYAAGVKDYRWPVKKSQVDRQGFRGEGGWQGN